jgi:hypothetical protein
LAFPAQELDGKFHSLKVDLHEGPRGYSLQARKRYFAPMQAPDPEADRRQIQTVLVRCADRGLSD